jgi:peptidyl-prolyl cis-trans isomerase SurA
MKKGVLLFAFFPILFSAYSQTLFTYGNHSVTAKEFLKAYNKSKTATPDKEKAFRDYLDLYTVFKLKVQAAKDLHLDTLPALQADLQNFRTQIEENYLKDDKKMNALMEEAFARSQKDIHVSHYFVEVPEGADTAKFFKAINEVSQQLRSTKNSSKDILTRVNTNGVNIVENDFGFITVFTLPYQFENIVYGLKPGQASIPLRTKKGWHVFKNEGERHAVGKVKLAQILITAPAGFINEREHAKKLADSLYQVLQSGGDFKELAKEYSSDRTTFINGGEMPEFGVAKYNPIFESHAFSLKKDNEVSPPFETEFGYHIIKRISATPVPSSKNDEAFMHDLKQEVLKDSRIENAKIQFVNEIIPKIGYKKLSVNEQDIWNVTDSSLLANRNITSGKVSEKTVLLTYNNNAKIKVSDWILFLRNNNELGKGEIHQSYQKYWNDFVAYSALQNYRNRLQDFNPEFKEQLNEFKDGNLLFEVMEKNVWGKAASDSAGLLQFYAGHKQKYLWNESADVIMFSCGNEAVSKVSIEELKRGKSWRDVMNENSSFVQADSGRYELSQIPVEQKINFTEGSITPPFINKMDGTVVFSKIIKLYSTGQQRSFEDARGLVINDYQNYLEKNWIIQLKKKYPIKIDEKVFQSLLK